MVISLLDNAVNNAHSIQQQFKQSLPRDFKEEVLTALLQLPVSKGKVGRPKGCIQNKSRGRPKKN